MPVFALIAYLFIGETSGGTALSEHAKPVLVGTLVACVPYTLVVIVLAPHLEHLRHSWRSLAMFFVIPLIFLLLNATLRLVSMSFCFAEKRNPRSIFAEAGLASE